MKRRIIPRALAAIAGIFFGVHSLVTVAAENSAASATDPDAIQTPPTSHPTAPVELSKSAVDVLQLVQAKVGDDTIVAFIKNSGASYSLSASAIVYLRGEGVSDRLLTTMLEHHKRVTEPAATTAPTTNYSGASNARNATTDVQPTTTYVESAPTYVPSSTVYVVPSVPTYTYSYGDYPYGYYYPYCYYPYYGGYYGYAYPAVSFSFAYSSFSHGGGDHGHGHGGGHHH